MKFVLTGLLLMLFNSLANGFEYTTPDGKKRELPDFHHIVDVELLDEMKPDTQFELSTDNKLQCSTCHGIKDMIDIPIKDVNREDKDFLRAGPYEKLTDFCYNCHQEKENTRENIHILLDDDGEIIEEKCKFCHEEVQKRDKAKKLSEIKLRQPVETICYACHLKTPHLNALEHMVELKDEKLKQWETATKQQNIYMPLTDAGKVTCVTCHTPHQKGVLDAQLAAAKQVEDIDLEKGITYKKHPWAEVYAADKKIRLDEYNQENSAALTLEYQRIHTEVLLRLPAKNGKLCLSCHTFEY